MANAIRTDWTISAISAVGVAATITRSAQANKFHVITCVNVTFSGASGTNDNIILSIIENVTTISSIGLLSAWAQFFIPDIFFRFAENTPFTVSLSAGVVGGYESLLISGYTIG